MLLQKLAELYILAWLCALRWPDGTTFQHEPASPTTGKRPELLIATPQGRLLFEVKAPNLTKFRKERGSKSLQLVGRIVPKEHLEEMLPGVGKTMPRDNPIKDFLLSADEKFRGLRISPEDRAYLVVVWDGQLHEPISALCNKLSGLLTPQSFAKDKQGLALTYPDVDGVLIISRLGVFINALEEEPHPGSPDIMDPRRHDGLPTALALVPGGKPLSGWLTEALRVAPAADPSIPLADLQPLDAVFWLRGK